jgi:uncharacterized repeat protein (TIGR01451 family)
MSPTEGEPFAPALEVTAVDAAGNVATSFTGNITLALTTNPAGGVLAGLATVPATGGVAVFNGLRIDKEGAGYVLQATSGSLTPASTAVFTVLSGKVDLDVALTVSNPTPAPLDVVTFTIRVTNNGPRTATGVQVTDDLPSRVTFVSATASQGTFDPATRIWTVGTLDSGVTATLTIQATVKDQP